MWRQLTSMRVALFLLLLLALVAIPGSLMPQRSADPNGVTQYFTEHPKLAPVLDSLQFFDVYSSVWFSAIYLLLFVSLIGCVIPRIRHHATALRTPPPKTPANLGRLPASAQFVTEDAPAAVIERAERVLRGLRYRTRRYDTATRLSVSAERGYLRETGNLLFHLALLGVLVAVAVGGSFTYFGQRVLVEGQTFANTLSAYDSFNPGRFFDPAKLGAYSLTLDRFKTTYEQKNLSAYGQPIDYLASVTVTRAGESPKAARIKVNEPLAIDNDNIYLLGNGYAPVITVRDGSGRVVFSDATPFLPQDANLTSLGVIKVTDIAPQQLGLIGFFYPTKSSLQSGAFTSTYPGLVNPMLTFNVFEGDLGINSGTPRSVYTLNTDGMRQIAGGKSGTKALELTVGKTVMLPQGRGSVRFDGVKRYVSLEIRHDSTQGWVLGFAGLAVLSLVGSLFVPRRRVWVAARVVETGGEGGGTAVEVAGLARGDDPVLEDVVADLAARISPADPSTTGENRRPSDDD